MRWITYTVCICLVAIQLTHSMPATKDVSQARAGEGENVLSETEKKEVRVPLNSAEDLETAASGEDNDKAESSQEEDLSDDIEISDNDENSRSKRLGVFGGLLGGGGGAGAEGGSGNFLFDIIRRTADGAARAAGTVYRLVVGTDDLGLHSYSNELSVPSFDEAVRAQASLDYPGPYNSTLIAGSGATEQQDESTNGAILGSDNGQSHSIDDGYQTGVPGPITRLFVIANRGLANLVQDLILRIAQTSERLVNFKARLITAII